jgi:multidrug efflux pump subunit AcrB
VTEANGGDAVSRGIATRIKGSDLRFEVFLADPGTRPLSAFAFTREWREAVGEIPEARSSSFSSTFGGPGGDAGLEIALSHTDTVALSRAADLLAARLGQFSAVADIEAGVTEGKSELAFRLREGGRAIGLTAEEVAEQVRAAFHGAEAFRQQEGRNEITVRVTLPEEERRSEADVENLVLRTPAGGEVALHEIAEVERGRAAARIDRDNGRRVLKVTASVSPPERANLVIDALRDEVLPQLARDVPGLDWTFSGREETRRQAMASFVPSGALALLLIYGCLAIPFRSWVQPVIVMTAIPFGFAGAVLGHLIMGMSLSIVSVFGVIALGGVVINAALVMIDYANKARVAGADAFEAVWRAGQRRFRPILLTTLTTFGGLAPMIFETSLQAQFLVPMAVSLGYGIVFATLIVLFLVPSLYLIVEDVRWLMNPRPPDPRGGGQGPESRAPLAAE